MHCGNWLCGIGCCHLPADKNASPTATDEFRRVTSAFEILGDPTNRKRYDRAMMDAEAKKKERRRGAHNQHTHRQQYQYQQREQSSSWQKQHNNMDRNERQKRHAEMITKSRSTQSRITKFTTKSEFEKTMLVSSTKQRYKTNCLIMLVANKHAEKWAESKLYFPYPFVGEDGSYERVLQVAKVGLFVAACRRHVASLSLSHTHTPSPIPQSPTLFRFDSTPRQN